MNKNKKSNKKKAKKKAKKKKKNLIDALNYQNDNLDQLSEKGLSNQTVKSSLEDKSFSDSNLSITESIESNTLVNSYNNEQKKVSFKSKLKSFVDKSKNFFKNFNQKTLNLCDSVEDLTIKSYDIIKENLKNAKNDFSDFSYNFMQKKLDQRKSNNIQVGQIDNKIAIQVKNLYMRYSKRNELSIRGCSFNVNYGDFHVFIGQNGAGKSTIIKMIIGLNLDYQGQILIEGIDGKNSISRKNMIFIPDKPIFPTEFSCFDYLLEFAKLHTQNNEELLKRKIGQYLNQFEISEIANRNPNKLSSGQKQKVLIIKILLLNSKIIILDEPTSNLDTITRKQFLDILKDLSIKNKVTIFISTHVLEEIKNYANSATFIDKGIVLWSGKVQKNDIVDKHNKLFGLE